MEESNVTAAIKQHLGHGEARKLIARVISLIEADGLEPPAEKTLYAKISGGRGIQTWLIPYFAKALGVTEQDLFDPSKREQIAREEVRKFPALYAQEFPEIQRMEGMVSLPFITIGAGAEAVANIALAESIFLPREILPTNFDPQHTLVGKILGDSMEPKFHENDIVVFDMVDGRDVVFPDAVYLVRYGDTIQIKQVQFLGNGDIRIISFNDTYPPVQPRRDLGVDWEIIGKPFIHLEAHISSRLQEAK